LKRALEIEFCANDTNLLEETKHTFCEGNERVALLVAINEVSLVANAEVKAGKIHNPEVGKQVILRFKYLGIT